MSMGKKTNVSDTNGGWGEQAMKAFSEVADPRLRKVLLDGGPPYPSGDLEHALVVTLADSLQMAYDFTIEPRDRLFRARDAIAAFLAFKQEQDAQKTLFYLRRTWSRPS